MSPQKCQLQEFRFPGLQYQLKRQMLKRDRLLIKSKAHGRQTLTSVAWISLPKQQSGEIT